MPTAKSIDHLHQGALLMRALWERDMDCAVEIDHDAGTCRVDGASYGIVYPDSWFERTAKLVRGPKSLRYVFVGSFGKGRESLLHAFERTHPGECRLTPTKRGRRGRKGTFDAGYYAALARGEFGLCPHHTTWPGDKRTLWTYRFVECCMVGAIPVLFRATPLASYFTDGFRFVWDDDPEHVYSATDARDNRALAERRFRLR